MNEPIQDKAPKPPGLIPKNVQSWLLIGLALLMVLIMWLTGGKKPQATARTPAPTGTAQALIEVNETKIAELQNRIQELQREQLVAQSALAQQTRLLGAAPSGEQQAPAVSASANPSGERTEDTIQGERRKREYLSLFASNIALSYRKAQNRTQPGPSASSAAEPPGAGPALP